MPTSLRYYTHPRDFVGRRRWSGAGSPRPSR